MSGTILITGRLIAAARALSGVGQMELANAAGISLATLSSMEAGGSAPVESAELADALTRALDGFGVVLLSEDDGMGAGVRLKFSRQDVRQIVRMENEGGMAKDDDFP